LRGIDSDKHFGREIPRFTVEDHAWNFDLIQQTGILRSEELKAGEAMLSVDDQKTGLRVFQVAYRFKVSQRPELQNIFTKQQDASRNCRLRLGRFVEIDDLADFPSAQQALECFLAPFDFADEFCDRIVDIGICFDRFALEIETAGEPNAVENVF